ncbi:MAG: 5'-nucleotidase [Gammaproteobacteria bacterium]|nr:5'-nucleotidase [Gammaproteobacteria bacterium]
MNTRPGLVVAVSSRALFDLEESHRVFLEQGVEAYARYQIARENEPLSPGGGYILVRKLLRLNAGAEARRVEVILLSRNSADTGLRVFNSIRLYGLDISRAAFTGGGSTARYVEAFGADLFLSANGEDVKRTLAEGVAAATILPSPPGRTDDEGPLRLAFDGDAVLFSDEAEREFRSGGLERFNTSEAARAREPLSGGPFKNFLSALSRLQSEFPAERAPLRTALITARAAPTHERVIRTLRDWGIRIDESLFLGGRDKGPFLRAFGADIYFDDQTGWCESARAYDVPAGHVPHGVANEDGPAPRAAGGTRRLTRPTKE